MLLLTGTCGSGKSTIAALLGSRPGWTHISEDRVWLELFGTNRSAFGSVEHRHKRQLVHSQVFQSVQAAFAGSQRVAIDVTLHESAPEGYHEYRAFFQRHRIAWAVRVLHPALEVAIARDASRPKRPVGPQRIAGLRNKFTGQVFEPDWFLDTSRDAPTETVERLIASGVA